MDIVEELETRGDELSLRAARYIRLKQRALGERDGPEQRESQLVTHDYNPHPKYPWFCADCGYAEHERLKHTRRAQ